MADIVWDALVIGAGIQGSATAYTLAKTGLKTLLLEQFLLPHTRGSSHGQSRLIRKAYDNEIYNEMMMKAYEMWRDLEIDAGVELFSRPHPGLLKLEGPPYKHLHITKKSFVALDLPYKWYDNSQLAKQYPTLSAPDGYVGFFDPNAGSLLADRAVGCYQTEFKKYGGRLQDGEPAIRITPGSIVTVYTNKGLYKTRRLMVLAGPWTGKLLRELDLYLPVEVTRVTVCHFREKDSSNNIPMTVQFLKQDPSESVKRYFYTLPSEYQGCRKIGMHSGSHVDPDYRDVNDNRGDIDKITRMVAENMPFLETKPCVIEPCLYTSVPGEDIIVDRHPKWKNIIIGAAFAGHGFKLAPVIGQVITELSMDKEPSCDLKHFTISRISTKQNSRL